MCAEGLLLKSKLMKRNALEIIQKLFFFTNIKKG